MQGGRDHEPLGGVAVPAGGAQGQAGEVQHAHLAAEGDRDPRLHHPVSSVVIMLKYSLRLIVLSRLLQQEMESTEPGIHLLDVQEKLQKFQLQESQVNAMAETIKKVSKQSKAAINNPDLNQTQLKMIETKMAELEDHFKALLSLVKKRQTLLEDSLSFFQLMQVWDLSTSNDHGSLTYEYLQDLEEEGQWCDERLAVCQASITAKDLRGLTSLQQRHKAGEDEMGRRHNR